MPWKSAVTRAPNCSEKVWIIFKVEKFHERFFLLIWEHLFLKSLSQLLLAAFLWNSLNFLNFRGNFCNLWIFFLSNSRLGTFSQRINIFIPPRLADFSRMFPDVSVKDFSAVTVINLTQKSTHDMSAWSHAMEEERENLMAAVSN